MQNTQAKNGFVILINMENVKIGNYVTLWPKVSDQDMYKYSGFKAVKVVEISSNAMTLSNNVTVLLENDPNFMYFW